MLGMLLIIFAGNMLFGNWIKSALSINLIVSILCECGIVLVIRRLYQTKEQQGFLEKWNKLYPILLFIGIIAVGMYFVIRGMKK